MLRAPRFTERAAAQIKRMIANYGMDGPPGKYMLCIGWELGLEDEFIPRPILGAIEPDIVPDNLQIECHGVRLAYNLPDRILTTVQSSVLDFDGKDFRFVDCKASDDL
jgi:hypothetical protein